MGNPAALHSYSKPYLSVADQLALLAARGMEITDFPAAQACLGRIGYYRLSGYWYPFRKSHVSADPVTGASFAQPVSGKPRVVVEDDFLPGTSFQQVMDLYVFDKRLRLLFLDALERVEVALRVDIALLIGARGPWAHRDPGQLHARFSKIDPTAGQNEFQRWLARLDATFNRSKDEFAKHFKKKYQGEYPPIWIAIELWDFGMLSVFLSGMKHADQTLLASKYGIPRAELLTSWMRNLNHIRNICAHHGRLWNRSPADQAAPPKLGEIPDLDHLIAAPVSLVRLYASAAALQYLLRTINPTSSWGDRLKDHCSSFLLSSVVKIHQSGFPLNWQQLALWS